MPSTGHKYIERPAECSQISLPKRWLRCLRYVSMLSISSWILIVLMF